MRKAAIALVIGSYIVMSALVWRQTKENHQLRRDNKNLAQYLEISRQGTKYAADNAALPSSEAGRVIFFGDSITERWGWYGPFFPGHHYVNRGISGQTTSQMLARFHQDVLDLQPTLIVLGAGTNDIGLGMLELATQENIESMVELAKARRIRVIIASVPPMEHFLQDKTVKTAEKVKALNGWLRSYSKEQGLGYVDYYSAMVDEVGGMRDGLSFEGTHPNSAGYAVMAPLAQAAIDREGK